MGSLAGMFHERSWTVRGSDRQFYPPISDFLRKLGIPTDEGFDPNAIVDFAPDLVVIGNAVSRDNPQAQHVMAHHLPYASFPVALREHFFSGRKPIVVMGTHGKTTTSALLAHVLEVGDRDPSFMIGGIVRAHQSNYRLGGGAEFVVEGDEYDTAYFDKVPKFMHYAPYRAVLTSIEFDHGDIYDSIDTIEGAFRKGVALLPKDGLLVYEATSTRVRRVCESATCRLVPYRIADGAPSGDSGFEASVEVDSAGTTWMRVWKAGAAFFDQPIRLRLGGRHNAENALAVIAIADDCGVDRKEIETALGTFEGVRRRQEVIFNQSGFVVLDDFAHHPTAVAATIGAVRSRYPDHTLWALFEPRTNTSRTNRFFSEYIEAFRTAQHVILTDVFNREQVRGASALDVLGIVNHLRSGGVDALLIPRVDDIVAELLKSTKAPVVILIMSNGAFGGIYTKLLSALKTKLSDGGSP